MTKFFGMTPVIQNTSGFMVYRCTKNGSKYFGITPVNIYVQLTIITWTWQETAA